MTHRRSFFRDNGLNLVLGACVLVALVGQALTGWYVPLTLGGLIFKRRPDG